MDKPIFFTKDDCPKCEALKQWAKGRKIEVAVWDSSKVGEHSNATDIMAQLADQNMELPVIWWRDGAMNADTFKINILSMGSKRK